MKLGLLFNLALLGVILAQDDESSAIMEDSEEMEEMMENGMMQAAVGHMMMPPPMKMPSENETDIMDRRKKNQSLKEVYLAAMLVKSLIGTFLSFVPPVMQVKGFGLSVINTIVNVARFILDMRRVMPMIRSVMSGWADRWDWGSSTAHRPVRPLVIQAADRKTIQVPDVPPTVKLYRHHFSPERHPYMRHPTNSLSSVYLPATTYAPHRSPFRHYYTRYAKDASSTPSSVRTTFDESSNLLKKSLDIEPTSAEQLTSTQPSSR